MNRYRISIAHSIGNSVVEHLYRIAQMRPPSLWWLILPLAALAILLGPVDYFLLKRLNRLPLTWLTSAGWILLFTAGAHYGVRYIRGGAMQLRAVSVLDSIADSDCAWATYFAGVYAPRSDEYRLDGLEPGQWWAAMAPSEEQMYANQQRAGRRQLTCVQEEGANLPVSMPVSIWTVQSLLGESPLKRVPFTAEVQRRADGATVKITNTGDKRIAKGYVLWADGYAEFGPVEAQVTQTRQASVRPFEAWTDNPRFVGRPDPSFGPMQGMRLPRYPPVLPSPAESAFLAQGCLSRSLAMHEHLRFGAALVCVVFEEAGSPLGIKDCSYETDHIQFARQLVLRTDR